MKRLYSALFLYTCFIFGSFSFSESHFQTDNEPQNNPIESERNALELQRRKEIAEKYLGTLEKTKEMWVDPFEMISYTPNERLEFTKPLDKSAAKVSYNLNSDEEPLFSDIKGDVIGSKTSKESEKDNDIVSGGHFSKDRQQICVLDSIYISRWLKKLILKVEKDSNSEPSSVTFSLDANMLDKLKELSTAKSLEISHLDELICGMLAQAAISKKEEFDWTVVFDYTKYIGWAVAVGSVLLFLMYILHAGCKYRPILTCIVIFCLVNIFWHWMHLYQQKIAVKHAELLSSKVPDECHKHDFGFVGHMQQYFLSFFKSDNCVKYHEALLVDPMWEVSLSVATSEALTAALFQPISVISRVINNAWKQLFDGMTWEAKIFFYLFVILLLLIVGKYRIRLPFFMGAIEPHYPVGSCVENLQPRKTLISSSKEKACKVVKYIQGIDSKALKFQQDKNMVCSFPGTLQNQPSKSVLSPRSIAVNWRPNKCSRPECSEACKNDPAADNESGNDSEEVGSDSEKLELVLPCEQHCSCCLSRNDVQYLIEEKDCNVCSSEESRNAVASAENEDLNIGTVSGDTNSSVDKKFLIEEKDCNVCSSEESRNAVASAENENLNIGTVSGDTNSSVDKKFIDDQCETKSKTSVLDRTSKTTTDSSSCIGVAKFLSETSDSQA